MDIDFEKLINLQKYDKEISDTSIFLEKIPRQIEEINKKIENSFQIVTQAKEKISKNQKKRRTLEAEVKDTKAKISKYKQQLNDVKSNREYSSFLKEIEEAQQIVDSSEEEIISEMLAADEIEDEIKEANQKYIETEKKLTKEIDNIKKTKEELETKKEKLHQEKEQLIPKIPSSQVKLYLKIYNNKNGIAMSPVKDEFCSMCHMRVRPQVLNELKENKKLILCENCGRVLFWQKKSD